MYRVSILELSDSIDRLNSTLQTTPTDWAQTIATIAGIVVAAVIALVVSSQQHRRHVVHEIRKEVAHVLAGRGRLRTPTIFFERLLEQGESLLEKDEVDRKRMTDNFDKHIATIIEAAENLSSLCKMVALISPPKIGNQALIAESRILEHILAVQGVAVELKYFITNRSTSLNQALDLSATQHQIDIEMDRLRLLVMGRGVWKSNSGRS